jgi:hypothetical protein
MSEATILASAGRGAGISFGWWTMGSVGDQSDVEVIREAFARWNARDIDYWIRHAQRMGV